MNSSHLASYAVTENNSRGRQYPVEIAKDRNPFRRDYTRIIHSQAFRRLQGKTQVFSSNLNDDRFRTRMSHSLEVEQIAHALCENLSLNSDLAAALAVGHDIGHAPFGHLGQDVLNDLMSEYGGFEHNLQALRLVDFLESPYLDHKGLNLMFETRSGLLKHCTPSRARTLGAVAERHLTHQSPPLEVQVVDLADAIAYCHADLEDAFVMGILKPEEIFEAPGYRQAWESYVSSKFSHAGGAIYPHPAEKDITSGDAETRRQKKALIFSVLRLMTSNAIEDVLSASRNMLASSEVVTLDDVRQCPPLIVFSSEGLSQHHALKKFSRERIYSHPTITSVRAADRRVLENLFHAYMEDPSEMGGVHDVSDEKKSRARSVTDYLAGMTDRFAYQEHARLKENRPDLFSDTVTQLPRRARPGN